MDQESVNVFVQASVLSELGHLVVTLRSVSSSTATIVVGRPGMPNITQSFEVGDAVIFETPDFGLFEVRVMEHSYIQKRVNVLITQLSPHRGLSAGLNDLEPDNLPFTPTDRVRIEESIAQLKTDIAQSFDLPAERLALISRKLDDIADASNRLGRKDWTNYAVGVLTSIIVAATLDRATAQQLLTLANKALSWVFYSTLALVG